MPYNGRMARLRTFLAVPLSDDIRQRLVALQERLAGAVDSVRWVEEENLHVTMFFLGDVDAEEIPAVCRAAQGATSEMPAFPVGLKGLGCFPHTRRPRIVWAGVGRGAAELKELYEGLSRHLEPLGFRREDRPFTPHVTLGRVKGDLTLAGVLETHGDFEAGEMVAEEVHVCSSELTRQGSRYQVLGRARLGG